MFAIAFDLVVEDTKKNHPKGVRAAYSDIGTVLRRFDFEWVQGSLYVTNNNDMANLLAALLALKALPWLPASVRDVRGFRVENWSDFTNLVKGTQPT
jgi:virulence-associated protein VapD